MNNLTLRLHSRSFSILCYFAYILISCIYLIKVKKNVSSLHKICIQNQVCKSVTSAFTRERAYCIGNRYRYVCKYKTILLLFLFLFKNKLYAYGMGST
jgi:hypothetical protein